MLGEFEQPMAFLNLLPRLHSDTAIEMSRGKQRAEIRWKPIALQR
jgi:hypothetical protein